MTGVLSKSLCEIDNVTGDRSVKQITMCLCKLSFPFVDFVVSQVVIVTFSWLLCQVNTESGFQGICITFFMPLSSHILSASFRLQIWNVDSVLSVSQFLCCQSVSQLFFCQSVGCSNSPTVWQGRGAGWQGELSVQGQTDHCSIGHLKESGAEKENDLHSTLRGQ